MSIALKEMVRQPTRYVPVWFALTLMVVLLVVLAGFRDGLTRFQTGSYRAFDGDVMVFEGDAELQADRSQVNPDTLTSANIEGVGKVGSIDSTFTVATVDATDSSDDEQDVVLFGYSMGSNHLPDPPSGNKAIVDRQLQRVTGIKTGETIKLGPTGETVTIAKIVDDLTDGAPTIWVNSDEWTTLVTKINPAAVPPDGEHQTLVVSPADGVSASELAERISKVDGLEGATIGQAIGALAVVQQQSNSFTGIIVVTFIVSLLVVALFFALITLEQTRLYAVMKALGAGNSELLRGIGTQAVVVTALAIIVGIAISAVLIYFIPPTLPVYVFPLRLAEIAIGLLFTGALGGLLTARRILRIDPATAIG